MSEVVANKDALATASTLAPLMIRASAGTGKTYQLTGRLLQILLGGASPDSILATTFTRKAAGEILNRLLFSLAKAATDPDALAELRQQIGCPDLDASRPAPLLHWILKEIHRLRICTLDSLFSQLARSFSFELRLPPGWQLTDEIEESWLVEQAISRMLEQFDESQIDSLFHMLNKGQAERNVANRLLQVVQNNYAGFRRSHRSAWTKLNLPAAPEPSDLNRAIGVLDTCDTDDRRIDKAMRKVSEQTRDGQWDEIVESKPVLQAVDAARNGSVPTYYKKVIPEYLVAELQVVYSKARHEFVKRLKMQTEATGDILESFDRNLQALKQNSRRFSFDDVSHQLAHWASQDADESNEQSLTRLATRMDASLDHILLDEFQDTAPVQWDVLRPLAIRAASDPPNRTFFCVGDTKQAIYGWRGGEAKIFDAVKLELPNLREQEQDTSFRSSPVITENVTRIFNHLHRHPSFSDRPQHPVSSDDWKCHAIHEFEDAFRDHKAHFSDRPGYFNLSSGPKTEGSKGERTAAHLRYVARQVAELATAAPDQSIGILTRTNRTVGQLIYLLREEGLDVSQEGGNPLVDSAAVELVLSAIRIAEHPDDLRWRFHLANSPLAESLGLTKAIDREPALAESIHVGEDLRDRFEYEGFVNTIRRLALALVPNCGEADRLRLRQLITLAHEYERSPQPRLSAFVELATRRRVQRPREARVRVMTIHQAKGLEFDAVVLPELDGSLSMPPQKCVTVAPTPTATATGAIRYVKNSAWELLDEPWQQAFGESIAAAMTESLCTLYVALTRPIHAMYVYIEPPAKKEFSKKSSAALLYHALGLSDPIEPESEIYTDGNPDWFQRIESRVDEPTETDSDITPLSPLGSREVELLIDAEPAEEPKPKAPPALPVKKPKSIRKRTKTKPPNATGDEPRQLDLFSM